MALSHFDFGPEPVSELDLSISPFEARFGCLEKTLVECAKHGPFVARRVRIRGTGEESVTGCQKCADDAARLQEAKEREARIAAEKAERLRKDLEARIDGALIPPRFQRKTFDSYRAETQQQERALGVCRDYAKRLPEHCETGRCLLLLGNVGTGKTHLANAIATIAIHEHGMVAMYTTASRICQAVKASFGKGERSERDVYRDYLRPDLLIIDEIGAGHSSDFERATLFEVINGRYEEMLPIIVISNLKPADLPACLGERSVDRLREDGGIAVVFDWESSRNGNAAHSKRATA